MNEKNVYPYGKSDKLVWFYYTGAGVPKVPLSYGGEELFSVNYKDPRPIYEQVKDSLRRAILTGVLSPDEKVPSVREAAAQLVINPNTIQKAYRELENEGYIYSVPGKGSFVSEPTETRSMRRTELFETLDGTVNDLRQIGVTTSEICRHITENHPEGNKL